MKFKIGDICNINSSTQDGISGIITGYGLTEYDQQYYFIKLINARSPWYIGCQYMYPENVLELDFVEIVKKAVNGYKI